MMEIKIHKDREIISTQCTWGDGPDVTLHIKRSQKHINDWGKDFVPLDLTANQAIRLGEHLIMNGRRALELEAMCESHNNE